MNNAKLIICIIILAIFLMVSPVDAKMVTAKVDDKGLMYTYSYGIIGTLHTEYGTIMVDDSDYNNIEVNDTIQYDTKKDTFWSMFWEVKVIK